ncbi:hypothetical protein PI124_g4072 [Phytophthora idaei]|nr:hypothetical protein PI125_g2010 [Phytophthora idaei]KAG3168494.1 hypothetical protein PI126_g3255 [Phytophthora idaei]KAG3251312.1 hypothetical protein PI124_g4072 [Phytophthora idaei]
MLAVAKNIDSTKALAKKLEGIQFTNWVHARESPDYVFKVLALNQMGTKTFASPQFSRWTEFLIKVNTKNPDVAIYATLGTYYSDDVLARMFAAAKQVDSSKTLATNLERIQLTN